MKDKHNRSFGNSTQVFYRILLIILVPLIIAVFMGKYIDNYFDVAPYGIIGSLSLAFIFTWVAIIIFYKRFVSSLPKHIEDADDNNNGEV